jgi:hypothetical protein
MAKVFLSSPLEDLPEYRDAALAALKGDGHEVLSFGDLNAGADLSAKLQQMIGDADIVVFIAGRRFGQWMAAEYDHAKRTNKPVLVFRLQDRVASRGGPSEAEDPLLARLRKEQEQVVGLFTSTSDLIPKLQASVRHLLERLERNRPPPPPPEPVAITLDDLPLAWRLVVGSFAEPELLGNLDPAAFVAAVAKWESASNVDSSAPWPSRLERARKALDDAQTDHEPSAFWLAWKRATRPSTTTAANAPAGGSAM